MANLEEKWHQRSPFRRWEKWYIGHLTEYLPSIQEALSLIPSTWVHSGHNPLHLGGRSKRI